MPAYKNKDNGTWYVMTQYTNWKGERKPKCKRGFDTKREAQEWEHTFRQQNSGDLDMPFSAFVEIYCREQKPRLQESTWQTKENIILSVGRFDNILNAKKQDVLIDAFRTLVVREKIDNWKLVLIGGSLLEPKNNSYLQYLEKKAANLPVEFIVNPPFNILKEQYLWQCCLLT